MSKQVDLEIIEAAREIINKRYVEGKHSIGSALRHVQGDDLRLFSQRKGYPRMRRRNQMCPCP